MKAKDLVVGNLYIDVGEPDLPQKYEGVNNNDYPGEYEFEHMICDDEELEYEVIEYKPTEQESK